MVVWSYTLTLKFLLVMQTTGCWCQKTSRSNHLPKLTKIFHDHWVAITSNQSIYKHLGIFPWGSEAAGRVETALAGPERSAKAYDGAKRFGTGCWNDKRVEHLTLFPRSGATALVNFWDWLMSSFGLCWSRWPITNVRSNISYNRSNIWGQGSLEVELTDFLSKSSKSWSHGISQDLIYRDCNFYGISFMVGLVLHKRLI